VTSSWGLLVFLGAFHGVNPGMGWLFAVALGMQENRSAAVWRAIVPIGTRAPSPRWCSSPSSPAW
jgi:threonine/homoserine/homoserine lactone efflux protein